LTATVNVSTISGEPAKPVPPKAGFRSYAPDEAKARATMDNPATLKLYPRPQKSQWQKREAVEAASSRLDTQQEAFAQEKSQGELTLSAGSCEYLIITKESYVPAFEPLLDWKRQKGLTGSIATVTDIEQTSEGADLKEKIRNFIRKCYEELGTEYVLLGGDTEIIPARGVYGEVGLYIDSNIPCDLYYGCLDGNWDYNGDGIYGEAGDGENGGEVDLIAEVYVGRAPVSNPSEADNFVRKTLRYEIERSPNLSRALWVGQNLDSRTWGSDSKEELVPLLPESFELTRLYQKQGTFSVPAVIDALNASPHIVNHLGHSTEHETLGLSKDDVDALQNVYPFMFYTQGCDSGAFDFDDSIAEHFVKGEWGAFAVVANSRYGWYSPETTLGTSQKFDRAFLVAVFDKGITNLGKALQESKEANIGDVLFTGSTRWCYFDLNLLGDPETPLFTATSKGLLQFDQARYSPRTPVRLSLADMDLNGSPLVTELALVNLSSPRDVELAFARETFSNSGVFVAELPLSTGAPLFDGVLQVADGDTITAAYEDANDGSGSARTVTTAATMDDSPPTISNVKVVDVRDTWAVVEWETNELATARVDYGVSPLFASSAFGDLVTNRHRVVVNQLEKETLYRFRVAATDLVGNEAADDNGGEYYSFTTKHQIILFSDDVEEGSSSAAGEWTSAVISGGVGDWQITTAASHSGVACWHTDDYPLPAANSLDTPYIDLRGTTTAQLSFWHRMLSEDQWDGGFVQIQREGTLEWVSLNQDEMTEGTPFETLSTGNPSGPVPGWSGDIPWERVTFDLSSYAGNRVRVRFRMESDDNTDAGEGDGWYIDDIVVSRAVGTVSLDRLFYKLGDTIVITVLDAAANADAGAAEEVFVAVSSTSEAEPEIVALTETEPGSAMFIGRIVTAKGNKANDGQLGVSDKDVVTVSYGSEESASAFVDIASPKISAVQSTQVADTFALIKWTTDELCVGTVYYGTDPLALQQSASQVLIGAIHELRLTELVPRSIYYFKVEAVDRAGNRSVDDNVGRLYQFMTLGFNQGGVISEDTVWRYVEGGRPYEISNTVYVGNTKTHEPVTLTIEPGVVVQLKTDKKDLFVRGGLVARGVTFEFDLQSGKSAHIVFEEGSWGEIENSVISVKGSSLELSGGIECYSSNVRFTNNIVRNAYYGIHCLSSSPTIARNSFVVCNYGVFLHAASGGYSSPKITQNTFIGCRFPIFCETGAYPVVWSNTFQENAYDGVVHGPILEDTLWPGYDCPHFLTGDLVVPAGRTLWIAPGATVRFAEPGVDLLVSGKLYAEGATIEFPVPPAPKTFITFDSTSSGSVRNCQIVGASPDGTPTGGIKCQSSNVSFTGNVIRNTYYGVFCGPSRSPEIANNTIVGCQYGVYAPDASPKIANCILWNNGDDLVGCAGTSLNTTDGDSGTGNISLDPMFRDAARGDFRLQPGSPCIDSGTSAFTPLLDADGHLRWDNPYVPNTGEGSSPYFDIGAYEFVLDFDSDLICDEWELFNGLSPYDAADAESDDDADGKTAREEYIAGTDPQDPSSRLHVVAMLAVRDSLEEDYKGTVVAWKALSGRNYMVCYADELWPARGRKPLSGDDGPEQLIDLTMWKPFSDVIEGTGDYVSFFDEWAAHPEAPFYDHPRQRFYRVEIR
jgi:parallel beta-helix repeat protein